ncbi:MAG: ribulose-phosphate 3-epimerase [Candidatus Goldiibacteriota bacterium HGW-Goldbacteria-1]|jgi:ribulose-phosphate 3-epimerase|nr:MAG: ribulose-phosphate 3-epimerase [Candidatus Goldiibacteriota bacterium HGW-Goldbacteria-1]
MSKMMLAPSILDSDFSDIKNTFKFLEQIKAEFVHLDIMDGNFVPNLTFGPKVIKSFRPHTSLPFDAHLMIEKPERYISNYLDAGCDYITIHEEASNDCGAVISEIHAAGKKAGLSVKPGTPVSSLFKYMDKLDLILIMTVEPGFGGQKFMTDMLSKITELRTLIDKNKYNCLIEIDGGINTATAPLACGAGADILVAGSAIFSAPDRVKAASDIRDSVKGCR